MIRKVVISTPAYWPAANGMATVSGMLSLALADRGYNITVVAPSVKDRAQVRGFSPVKVIERHSGRRRTLVTRYAWDARSYQRVLQDEAADVYLFLCWETWMVHAAVPFFRELPGCKVLASHGTSALWRPPGWRGWARRVLYLPHWLRYPRLLKAFDYFILLTALSDKARFYDKALLDRLEQTNWVVIPNGSDPEVASGSGNRFRERHQLNGRLIVLCVSNYHWAKNQEGLIRAFRRAKLQRAALVLIGSELNHYANRLRHFSEAHGNESEDIRFLTGQSRIDIRDAYCAADLFVSASLTEAQPLVVLDAMASATPFISFAVGCVTELPGGVVVPTEGEMASAIHRLGQDAEERMRLGAAGRKACQDRYNWQRTALEYDRLFCKLLAKRNAASAVTGWNFMGANSGELQVP